MNASVFVKKPEEYVRDLDMVKHAREDLAYFLHKSTTMPMELCREFVTKEWSDDGKFKFIDPIVKVTERKKGQRELIYKPFSDYMENVIKNDKILSPTLAVYTPTRVQESLLAKFMQKNIALRQSDKKSQLEAEMRKDNEQAKFFKNLQTRRKTKNNGCSGAFVSPSTPLYNKTAHSTLTSGCRSGTSYGNAHNEKFISGNRHWWCADVCIMNMITICRHTDMVLLQKAMDTYKFHYPTYEETMACVRYSTDLYWPYSKQIHMVEDVVRNMTSLERAAVVYVGDMYHLAKYNDEIVRTFLTKLSKKMTPLPGDEERDLANIDDDLKVFISLICREELDGKSIKDIRKEQPEKYAYLIATRRNAESVLLEYELMIRAMWVTDNMPPSIAMFPASIRRCAIASDTDSTIFTVQEWVRWYSSEINYTAPSKAIAATMVYLTSQVVIHILALMSTTLGVDKKYLHELAMKNEYMFDVFVLTSRAKHYWAQQNVQEGNVYKDKKLEKKGVELRDSNVPAHVMKRVDNICWYVIDSVVAKGSFSLDHILDTVYEIEMDIITSIENKKVNYLRRGNVKNPGSYKKGEDESAYQSYIMWESVFAEKYGHTIPPDYRSVCISVDLNTKGKVKKWLDNMVDRDISTKMQAWLNSVDRAKLTTIYLPEEIVRTRGLVDEIMDVIDVRKTVFATTRSFYLQLESVGVFLINKNLTRLVSDFHKPKVKELETIVSVA